jgi:predicted nucleic acid-binding protein
VVNEVCSNLLRKAGYAEPEIRQPIDNFQARYPILNVTADIVRHASALGQSYHLSYWDSVVVATALAANCTILYSEDGVSL